MTTGGAWGEKVHHGGADEGESSLRKGIDTEDARQLAVHHENPEMHRIQYVVLGMTEPPMSYSRNYVVWDGSTIE